MYARYLCLSLPCYTLRDISTLHSYDITKMQGGISSLPSFRPPSVLTRGECLLAEIHYVVLLEYPQLHARSIRALDDMVISST